jgi:hypothetical protein
MKRSTRSSNPIWESLSRLLPTGRQVETFFLGVLGAVILLAVIVVCVVGLFAANLYIRETVP